MKSGKRIIGEERSVLKAKIFLLLLFYLFNEEINGYSRNAAYAGPHGNPPRRAVLLYVETPTVVPVLMPSLGAGYVVQHRGFSFGIKGTINVFFLDGDADQTRLLMLPAYSIGLLFERKFSNSGLSAGFSPGFRHFLGYQGTVNSAAPPAINSVDALHEFGIREIFIRPYFSYRLSGETSIEFGYLIPVRGWNAFTTRIVRPEIPENQSAAFQKQIEESKTELKQRVENWRYYYMNIYLSFVVRI